ncbi:MAG: transmembrane sensor [Maribacter sp.]|jgi:transmembrane sensor
MSDLNDKDTLLARWLSGDLSAKELKSLESQDDFNDLKRIVDGVDQLKLPAYDKQAAFAKLKAKKTSQQNPPTAKIKRLSFMKYVAVAASILLLVGFFMFNPFGNNISTFETQFAEQENITLPDGSEILLNHQSKVNFNTKDWNEKRVVNLEGEAFFKVKKGSQFKVVSDNGTVAVLGTSFNIYTRNKVFEVSCYTGEVEVKSNEQTVQLMPSQKSSLDTRQLKTSTFEVEDNPSWKKGLSRFDTIPLERVIQALELQFDINIQADNIDNQEIFTGIFLHKDIETALKMVFEPMGISYLIKGNEVTLSK